MHDEHAQLLGKIMAFEIDQGQPALSFTERLARENGWKMDYASRVVVEYRRFLFLICTAGHPVTPSEQVDEAWHLHLTYTRSYWDRLCGQTLQRAIHHEPTRGGDDEDQKFRSQYERTCQRYAQVFGHPSPADIWPDVETRFAIGPSRRISSNKPESIRRPLLISAASLTLGLALTALTFGNRSKTETTLLTRADGGLVSLLLVGFLVFGLLILAIFKYGGKGGKGGGGSGCGGCSAASCGGGCGGGGCS